MTEQFIEKPFSRASLEIIRQANAIIADYAAQGYRLTLRQLYYQFVARDLLANTQRSYKRLGNIISGARLAGLVDWKAIEDRTRNLESNPHWASPAAIIRAAARSFRLDARAAARRAGVLVRDRRVPGRRERMRPAARAPGRLSCGAGSIPGAAIAHTWASGGTMPKLAVLWITLLCSIGAMSAYGSGAKDQIDPALTDEVETLLERSVLWEFADLEPVHYPAPVPAVGTVGPAFIEIPLVIEDGHEPLTDLDVLYGVDGPFAAPLPAYDAPPALLVDDTPTLVAWGDPPPDVK